MQAKKCLLVLISVSIQLLIPLCCANDSEELTTVTSLTTESASTHLKIHLNSTKLVNSDEENEDDQDEDGGCDGRISSFVRNIDSSDFLPDDYEEVSESMHQIDVYHQINHLNDTLALGKRLFDYGQKLKNNKDIESTMFYLSSVFMDKIYSAQISAQCSADLVNVMSSIRNQEFWAMKFPDSFAHVVPSGLLRGHISSFGEYDECIGIKSPMQDSGRHIYGQYCQVQFRSVLPPVSSYDSSYEDILLAQPYFDKVKEFSHTVNLNNYMAGQKYAKMMIEGTNAINNNIYHYGVCFPQTCNPDDIEKLFNEFLYPITKIPVRVEKRLCDTHKDLKKIKLDGQQWTAVISLTVLSCIVFLSSLYHLYLVHIKDPLSNEPQALIDSSDSNNNNHNNGIICDVKNSVDLSLKLEPVQTIKDNQPTRTVGQEFILAFSAVQNVTKLLKVDNRYGVLDTIRLILTFFVYALQAFHFTAEFGPQMLRSIADTVPLEMATSNAYWFARTPGLWIDGFMFTLGVMLILSQFGRLKKDQGQFSFFTYVWKRWYRLSIAMVGTFFAIFLFPLVGDGPIWFINDQWLMPPCKKTSSIISSFLFYSNWNPAIGNYSVSATFPICNPPTWFLSMSTQLYLLAPLVFVPLFRWPRFGVGLTLLIIMLSPLSTLSPRIFLGHSTYLEANRIDSISQGIRSFLNYHTNPVQYVTTLCIGMLTGYLIKCQPNLRIIGGRVTELILWVSSFGSIVLIFAWHNSFWEINKINPEYSILAWFVLSKFMIASSLGYITYMCCTGRGGIVNRIVTIRLLQPLAKLSYGIYLLRVPTIFYRVTSARHTYEMHYYQMFQNIFIDFFITSVLAFFLHLLFEAPSTNIMKIFEGERIYELLKRPTKVDQQVEKAQNGNTNQIVSQDGNFTDDIQSSPVILEINSKQD